MTSLKRPYLAAWLCAAVVGLSACSQRYDAPVDHPRLTAEVSMCDVTFHSAALNRDMPYRVVFPAKLVAGRKLCAVYVLHGGGGGFRDWTNFSDVARVAEQDVILVMPEGNSSYYMNSAERPQDRYEDYIANDLISDVETQFPVMAGRANRAVIGISMGGFGAINLSLKHPDLFAFAGALSPAIDVPSRPFSIKRIGQWREHSSIFGSWGSETRRANDPYLVVRTIDPVRMPYLYLSCGEQEGLLPANRKFAKLLAEHHFRFEFHTGRGAHDWNQWNPRLPDVFRSLSEHLAATKYSRSFILKEPMSSEESVTIRPATGLSGSVSLPGDKSISHRYAMLGAIAEAQTNLENFSTGADCASTLGCVRSLGIEWERNGSSVEIQGRGAKLHAPKAPLDCGNSGSTIRMLSGILAGQDFTSELEGDESLSRRPMARIIQPLEMMGAKIESRDGGRPPIRVTGSRLKAIDYKLPVASAQVKTSLLFAGLFAHGTTRVEEPIQTRDHGELALQAFGAQIDRRMREVSITGRQRLRGIEAVIPGDISSAAFFLCAAGLFPDSQLTIPGVLLNPTRARLLDFLIGLGLRITMTDLQEQHGELVGALQVQGGSLKGARIAGGDTAALIDEIPVLAAIAPYTSEGIEIRDARELRVKESDRIASVATNLRLMGAEVEEFDDGLRIPGGQKLHGASLDSFGDHRIAMAFAVAALRADGETEIKGSDAAVISFPEFFETLDGLVQR